MRPPSRRHTFDGRFIILEKDDVSGVLDVEAMEFVLILGVTDLMMCDGRVFDATLKDPNTLTPAAQ